MAFQPLRAEDLCVGLYIKLVGSWFKHPFSSNTFKIQTEKELATLQALRNFQILYDPYRSDPSALPKELQDESQKSESSSEPPFLESHPQEPGPAFQESLTQREVYERHRQKLVEAEKTYHEVLRENKTIIHEVKVGYVKGVRKAEQLVTTLADLLAGDGTLVALMNLMGSHEFGNEFYYHSLNVAMLSMIIGHEFDFPPEMIKAIGIGALFHDIGELDEQGKFIRKVGNLTQAERRAFRRHPETGRKMLERGFGVPDSSLDAISQHHERLNGTGYPRGLTDHALHFSSKIVMVADAYDELCNQLEFEKSLTPYQALSYLYERREDEFCEEVLVALIRNLGVYPPSSVVKLSDGSIGIVCTINLLDRMRPMVMLYASDIPRDEAKMVDLALEETLGIKQCLQPRDVPKRVWNYLNPRGMISYFAIQSERKEAPSSNQSSPMAEDTQATVYS